MKNLLMKKFGGAISYNSFKVSNLSTNIKNLIKATTSSNNTFTAETDSQKNKKLLNK